MLASYRMLYAHQCRKFGCRIVYRHLSHFMVVHSKHILNVIEYKIEWWCFASCPRIQPRIGWIIQKICRRKDIEFAWLHADYRSIHSKTRFWEKQKMIRIHMEQILHIGKHNRKHDNSYVQFWRSISLTYNVFGKYTSGV